MAVLFITHKYPPSVGGMEEQSFQLIHGLSQKRKCYSIIFNSQKESIMTFFGKLKFRVKKILELYPEIDMIHLNDGLMGALFTLLNVNSSGRKVFVTIHGLDIVFPLAYYQKNIIPRMVKKIDQFICVSNATMHACIERNITLEKLCVIKNGVDITQNLKSQTEEFNCKDFDFSKDKIILAIGRPVKRKGFSWFAKNVMPLLDDTYKFVHIGVIKTNVPFYYNWLGEKYKNYIDLFLGRPNDCEELIQASKDPRLRTFLLGRLSEMDKTSWIHNANIMVMPNINVSGDMEGFGLVALEASILGKTVFASNTEGIKDAIIQGKNGFLCSPGDANNWKNEILNHFPSDRTNTSFRNFTIQNYSWDKMVSEYENVFSSI